MGIISGFVSDFLFSLWGDSVVADLGKDDLAEFACSLRVIAGSQEGLSDGWHDGQASIYPGGLDFEVSFHAKDGLRTALRTAPPTVSVTVTAIAAARQRQPNDAETRKVNADSQIVELTTDTATLEWAVPTQKLKAALERVQSSWPSEVPSA
jgi:hypothetical protein